MEIVRLFVYPVKSLQGTELQSSVVGSTGLAGDRSHGLRDATSGIVLTGRRDPSILFATGIVSGDGDQEAEVVLPDGTRTSEASLLSSWIGRPIELIGPTNERSTYEIPIDFEDDDSPIESWQGPSGSFHDSPKIQVSVVATGDLRSWDVRRFRPNVVVEAESLDHLVGHRVRFGSGELEIVAAIDRCVMVTRPQPGGIERDLGVLRTIIAERATRFGVGGLVRRTGSVSVGDSLEIIDAT